MSELTPCNFCNLKWIRCAADKAGKAVTLVRLERCAANPLGGVDVLVHDVGEEPDREKHFRAWFMALTDHCCC